MFKEKDGSRDPRELSSLQVIKLLARTNSYSPRVNLLASIELGRQEFRV